MKVPLGCKQLIVALSLLSISAIGAGVAYSQTCNGFPPGAGGFYWEEIDCFYSEECACTALPMPYPYNMLIYDHCKVDWCVDWAFGLQSCASCATAGACGMTSWAFICCAYA